MIRATRLVLACSLAAALGACGPSTPTAAPATETPTVAPTAGPTLTPPTPSPLATSAPTAAATIAGVLPCGPSDLKASHGLVDGAAGSVFTQVVLEAASTCTVDATPSLGLQDKTGTALVPQTPAAGGPLQLDAGSAYTSTIRLANWCGPDPAFPVSLLIWIDADKLVVGGGSFPSDGMPGCLGSGAATLEATPWTASP